MQDFQSSLVATVDKIQPKMCARSHTILYQTIKANDHKTKYVAPPNQNKGLSKHLAMIVIKTKFKMSIVMRESARM